VASTRTRAETRTVESRRRLAFDEAVLDDYARRVFDAHDEN
jgi:hypothetical protein